MRGWLLLQHLRLPRGLLFTRLHFHATCPSVAAIPYPLFFLHLRLLLAVSITSATAAAPLPS